MLLRTEKFFREFFKLKSYWMYLDRSGTAKIMRKTIPAREIVVLLYKKRNCDFCQSFGIVEQEWLRPTYMSKEVWLCSAPGTIWSPSTPGATLPKWDGVWITKITNCQNHQQPHLPTTANTDSKNHPPPRSWSTEITKHQYPQQPHLQTPRPSRVPFYLTFSRAGVNCTVFDPSQ